MRSSLNIALVNSFLKLEFGGGRDLNLGLSIQAKRLECGDHIGLSDLHGCGWHEDHGGLLGADFGGYIHRCVRLEEVRQLELEVYRDGVWKLSRGNRGQGGVLSWLESVLASLQADFGSDDVFDDYFALLAANHNRLHGLHARVGQVGRVNFVGAWWQGKNSWREKRFTVDLDAQTWQWNDLLTNSGDGFDCQTTLEPLDNKFQVCAFTSNFNAGARDHFSLARNDNRFHWNITCR